MAKDAGKSLQDVPGEVQRLLAAGKAKQAVELAKDEHKRRGTADSERLLVDAYLARIQQFQEKGAVEDAKTLLNLVRERFPSHRERLTQLELRTAAVGGDVNALLAPLARPDVPEEVRNSIETAIRQQIVNLADLANASVLPADHSLRQAAAAVWKAFQAVTAGPVTDEQVALPEVSRRSPLAAWKMLIRAIAAFYRQDGEGCRRAMEGIADDSAAAKLRPVLTSMLEGKPAGTGFAGALQSRVGGNDQALRAGIEHVEKALTDRDERKLKRAVQETLGACAQVRPELLDRLRENILAKCVVAGAPQEALDQVFVEARKCASFWRLWAKASEMTGRAPEAAFQWDRFLRHALHEKLIQPGSPEEAAVRLHIARLVSRIDPQDLLEEREYLLGGPSLANYYRNQPPEIAALKPGPNSEIVVSVYDVGRLFERAAQLDPDPETFRQWWAWSKQNDLSNRAQEDIATVWSRLLPGDPEPLLHLSSLAEERNALKLALKHLSAAEAIDALNPAVRRARLRLTLATAWRHFKDARPHLVEQDLAELENLPAMQEGDRPAVLGALRAAWHLMRQEKDAAQQAVDAVTQRFGPLLAATVVDAVGMVAKIPNAWRPRVQGVALPEPRAVAEAVARMSRLGSDLNIRLWRPQAWDAMITQVLAQTPCPLSNADLLAIGNGAIGPNEHPMAYLASTAGLASANGPAAARFLLLRARSLPHWAGSRARQCLRAAKELAQQAHDPGLLAEISNELEDRLPFFGGPQRMPPLGDELMAEVLKQERLARAFPASLIEAERPLVVLEPKPAFAPFGGFDEDDEDDDYDDEHDEDDYESDFGAPMDDQHVADLVGSLPPAMLREMMKKLKLPKDMPPEALPILLKIVAKYGRIPNPVELFKMDPKLAEEYVSIVGNLDPGHFDDEPDDLPPFGFGGGGRRGKKRPKRRR